MMVISSNQYNTTGAVAIIFFGVGTTSMCLENYANAASIIPSEMHDYNEYQQKQEQRDYLLKHEVMPRDLGNPYEEPLVEMPAVKSVKVKFKKINILPLEFVCVENDEGFME